MKRSKMRARQRCVPHLHVQIAHDRGCGGRRLHLIGSLLCVTPGSNLNNRRFFDAKIGEASGRGGVAA